MSDQTFLHEHTVLLTRVLQVNQELKNLILQRKNANNKIEVKTEDKIEVKTEVKNEKSVQSNQQQQPPLSNQDIKAVSFLTLNKLILFIVTCSY